jgi:hypothetical protein
MGIDFLTASTHAAKDLSSAQGKRAALERKAAARLATAQDRFDAEMAEARDIEAAAWKRLMAVPGMTAATAAQIGGISAIKVSRWISGSTVDEPCN